MAARVFTFRRTLVQTRQRGHTAVRSTCYRFGLAGASAFPAKDGGFAVDYTNRRGIGATGCALPAGADPSWRSPLTWAARIETVDYRKNSRQCRDDVLGLPREMVQAGLAEQAVADYAQKIAAKWKTPVHWVIHDVDGPNPHAHVIYAGRPLASPDRFAKNRDRAQDHKTKPARGKYPAQTSLTDLHSGFWIEVAAAHSFRLDFTPVGDRAQTHVGPHAWAIEQRAIEEETAQLIAAAIADLAPHEQLTPDQIQEAAAAASEGLTVTEALALDREPVTEQMQHCPKPTSPVVEELDIGPPPAPAIAPALGCPAPVLASEQPFDRGPEPAIEAAAELPPPAPAIAPALGCPPPALASEQPFDRGPEPAIEAAAELPPPAPAIAPALGCPPPALASEQPFDRGPEPAIEAAAELPPPAPAIAPALGCPPPALASEQPFDRGPEPAIEAAAELPPPAPAIAPALGCPPPALAGEQPLERGPEPAIEAAAELPPPAPAIAPALGCPAPVLASEQPFDRGPEPAIEAAAELPPPAPAIAPALPEPQHITKKKAEERAKEDAYKSLERALSEEAVEEAGIAIIKNDAGDASAYPFIPGIGKETNGLVIGQLRQHTERFLVPARHRRKPDMTGHQYTRWQEAIEGAIDRWRTWWSVGGLLAQAASARIIPQLIKVGQATFWQEEQAAKQEYAEEQAAKRAWRESNDRAAARRKQQLRAQPSSHRGQKPGGQKYGE